jgi:hypothetical protein
VTGCGTIASAKSQQASIMKEASIADVEREVEAAVRESAFAQRFRNLTIEAADDGEGGSFLRVSLKLDRTNDLEWDTVKPLVESIRRSVERIDDRFPSVRFADAA